MYISSVQPNPERHRAPHAGVCISEIRPDCCANHHSICSLGYTEERAGRTPVLGCVGLQLGNSDIVCVAGMGLLSPSHTFVHSSTAW